MLKIEKEVRILIDGEDVNTLSKICECARIYMGRNAHPYYNWFRVEEGIGQFSEEEVQAIGDFINQIFDSGGV